jgi:hypothetical protein
MEDIPKAPMPLALVQNTLSHNGWKNFTMDSQIAKVQGEGMYFYNVIVYRL